MLTIIIFKGKDNIYILGNNEEVITKLDDSMLTLNNILGSRFVAGIKIRVEKQINLFSYLQTLLDEWILH